MVSILKAGIVTKVYDRTVNYALKTKDDDDGASLADQLGLEGKDTAKLAEKIGTADNIRLAEQGGDVGRAFKAVEYGFTEQTKWSIKIRESTAVRHIAIAPGWPVA